jgi:hypothetical protein
MSHQLLSHSPDLVRLQDEGYEVALSASNNHVVVTHVPYVTSQRIVAFGTLVAVLSSNGSIASPPSDHVATFSGEYPCDHNGVPIELIRHSSERKELDRDLVVDHMFSAKPSEPYQDFYAKMTTYVAILGGPAFVIDRTATAKTFRPRALSEEESVFVYPDSASSRAGIGALSQKLEMENVAIVGTGGSGSYVLDFIAKTPIKQIHLYDEDRFYSHNAFRAPGAASIEELYASPLKADYFSKKYSSIRRKVISHPYYMDASRIDELGGMDFVFLCLDGGADKRTIVEYLVNEGIPFVDVGMGLNEVDGALSGLLRTTAVTKAKSDHVASRIPFSDGGPDNEYERNIQVVELNALNAALAVIRWKKLCGFYRDSRREHSTVYSLSHNSIINEDTSDSSQGS